MKDKIEQSRNDYQNQRNLCATLLRRANQQHSSNVDPNLVTENKKFWKTVKSLFSDKISNEEIISLTKNEKVRSVNSKNFQ